MKNDPSIVAEFIKSKLADQGHSADGTHPLITISRQHGVGGYAMALRIAEILTQKSHALTPWIAVDKNIAEHLMTNHHLPKQVTSFLTEEQTGSIEEYIDLLFRLHTPREAIVEKMIQTMLHLANIGHVVLVGRGSNVITAGFPRAVHLRLVASMERRVEWMMEDRSYTRKMAETEIRQVDNDRRKFVETFFRTDPDDIRRYDMVFNMDRVSREEAAQLAAHLVESPTFREKEANRLAELRHQVLGV